MQVCPLFYPRKLAGLTLFITGASRGIGKAIALKAAADGANIVIAAKSVTSHPKLPGTIYSSAEEVTQAEGKCLPIQMDVRNEDQIKKAVKNAVSHFGGIDILVNNAGAITTTSLENTLVKKFDLMTDINYRGAFLCTQACLEHLKKSQHAHVLNICPPLNLNPDFIKNKTGYIMSKYSQSLAVLGLAEELREHKIAVNGLWTQSAVYTAAMLHLGAGTDVLARCRKPEFFADAAYAVLIRDSQTYTGNLAFDGDILKEEGVTDWSNYSCVPGSKHAQEFYDDCKRQGLC